jgi:hypothetical protein
MVYAWDASGEEDLLIFEIICFIFYNYIFKFINNGDKPTAKIRK